MLALYVHVQLTLAYSAYIELSLRAVWRQAAHTAEVGEPRLELTHSNSLRLSESRRALELAGRWGAGAETRCRWCVRPQQGWAAPRPSGRDSWVRLKATREELLLHVLTFRTVKKLGQCQNSHHGEVITKRPAKKQVHRTCWPPPPLSGGNRRPTEEAPPSLQTGREWSLSNVGICEWPPTKRAGISISSGHAVQTSRVVSPQPRGWSVHSALMKSRVRFQGICNKAEPYCCSTPLRSERDRKWVHNSSLPNL